MKHFFVLALASMLLMPSMVSAQAIGAAPADEYFGHLKMSTIGIRNRVHDLVSTAVHDPEGAQTQLGMAERVEDSMEDLARKYPRDSWVEGLFIGLERYYAHLPEGGREHLTRLASWMHANMRHSFSEFEAQHCADSVASNNGGARCQSDEDLTVGLAYHRRP